MKVLVISKGVFHPTVFCRKQLKKILLETEAIDYDFNSNLKKIDGIDIKMYHTVVLFFHEKKIKDFQLKSLISYVKNGGQLFCIHGALASFKKYDDYLSLIGSKFIGHDEIKEIHITGDINFTLKDELYEFETSADCKIHLKSGTIPVYWTRNFGKGTVACLSPGHRTETFKNEKFKNLIKSIIVE